MTEETGGMLFTPRGHGAVEFSITATERDLFGPGTIERDLFRSELAPRDTASLLWQLFRAFMFHNYWMLAALITPITLLWLIPALVLIAAVW